MAESPSSHATGVSLKAIVSDSIRYWERWRILYNSVLTLVVVTWIGSTWPHFHSALTLGALLPMLVLALLANVCYCAVYLADIPLQYFSSRAAWGRWRWGLWLAGTMFAIALANYWIADEIYPFVR